MSPRGVTMSVVTDAPPDPWYVAFGSRIREARRARGWSQERLGAAVGVSQPAVSDWELGRTAPDPFTVWRIAVALHTSVQALYGDYTD